MKHRALFASYLLGVSRLKWVLYSYEEDNFYKFFQYRNNPKYWDRQAWANNVDLDQMRQNAAFDQSLHCLPVIQHYFSHINRK